VETNETTTPAALETACDGMRHEGTCVFLISIDKLMLTRMILIYIAIHALRTVFRQGYWRTGRPAG
jgi:hypothetical protein